MGIKEFFQDEGAVRLGLGLGKVLSLRTGRQIAAFMGGLIASRQKSSMVRNIKTNQWVVSGGTLDKAELAKQSRDVIQGIITDLFEYFYYYQHPEEGKQLIRLSSTMQELLAEVLEDNRSQIILGPHVGNFDLFGMMLAQLGLKPFVLSIPNPNNAYKMQNELREAAGMKIAPITFSAFRQAKQALREGACVITGLDRPMENEGDTKYRPRFFGRPASLPTFYVHMAIETGTAVRVACGLTRPDRTYYLDCSEPIHFEARDNLQEEIIVNAEKVMVEAEKFIQAEPKQWAMFYPIWPEVLPQISHLI